MSSGYSQLKQGTYLIRLNFRVTNVAVCDIIKVISAKMTFAETKVSLNDIYKYTSSNGLKGSFMDTERYEYK